MADSLHTYLAQFRDSVLNSVANLEFKLRDTANLKTSEKDSGGTVVVDNDVIQQKLNLLENTLSAVKTTMEEQRRYIHTTFQMFEDKLSKGTSGPCMIPQGLQLFENTSIENEIMKIQKPLTADIFVPTGMHSQYVDTAEAVNYSSAKSGVSAQSSITLSESDNSGEYMDESTLEKFKFQGMTYYRDDELTVYKETDDGYEEIGLWDSTRNIVVFHEIEEIEDELQSHETDTEKEETDEQEGETLEEETEEEVEVECTPFEYKGVAYLRDPDNNVYSEDGEGPIGTWNGKKILKLT
jgi:hypothetical protein